MSTPHQQIAEDSFLDVAVGALAPVAEKAVIEFVAEQREDAVPGGALGFADGAYRCCGLLLRRTSMALHFFVRRYCCKRLFGLSGRVISIQHFWRHGSR